MNFKLAIKNLFATKNWTVKRHGYGETPGVKYGDFYCRGNFFQMVWAMFLREIH